MSSDAKATAQTGRTASRRTPMKGVATTEKRRRAAELFAEGVGYVRVSRILNLPANTVKDWSVAWRAGRFTVEVPDTLYAYDRSVRERVVRLRSSGTSWRDIAEKTGVSPATARKWVERHAAHERAKRQGAPESLPSPRLEEGGCTFLTLTPKAVRPAD